MFPAAPMTHPSPILAAKSSREDDFLPHNNNNMLSDNTEPLTDEEEDESLSAACSPYKPLKQGHPSIFGRLLQRLITPEKLHLPRSYPKTHGHNTLLKPKPSTKINSCLVYLIRHGEASHNVLEKRVQEQAKKEAEAQGLSPQEVKERMEEARESVLADESLRDARLSHQGRQEARRARRELEQIVRQQGLNRPTKVIVSPLTRTLETADLIFPDHESICVYEELQERQTGKPCDCRQSSTLLHENFQRFKMDKMKSFMQDNALISDSDEDDDDDDDDSSFKLQMRACAHQWSSEGPNRNPRLMPSRAMSDPNGEDKETLRARTQKLLGLLDEPSIAVVTHKGYLRELERGTLNQPDAKEFQNAEIRVYRIHLDEDQGLKGVQRIR